MFRVSHMGATVALPFLPFAGVGLEVVSRIERARPSEAPAALARWKRWQAEGFEVTALAGDEGGQVVTLVGLGYRYRPSERL
jgi:hypothetical protein